MTTDTSKKTRRRRIAPAYLRRKGAIGPDGKRGPDRAITYLWVDGTRRQVHLGLWMHPESRERFAKVLSHYVQGEEAEALAASRQRHEPDDSVITVEELVGQFLQHAQSYYRRADGTQSGEHRNFIDAATPLLELYGDLPVDKFGCPELERVREHMTKTWRHRPRKDGRSRLSLTTVNDRVQRIRRMFRWGVPKRLVTAAVVEDLRQLENLKRGRCAEVKDPEKILPVAWEDVEAVLNVTPPTIQAMIRLQWASGARPGEICAMRSEDLERTNNGIWRYRPQTHKTQHLGKDRIIPIDAEAQNALEPFLLQVPQPPADMPLFSPARAQAERAAQKRATRRTKVQPSQVERANRTRERNAARSASDRYDVNAYRLAIHYGVDAVNASARRLAIVTALAGLVDAPTAELIDGALRRLPSRMTHAEVEASLAQILKDLQAPNRRSTIAAAMKAVQVQREVPYWGPHQIRHAYGFRMGPVIGVENLRVLMGHSDIRTTMRYFMCDVDRAFDALARIPHQAHAT